MVMKSLSAPRRIAAGGPRLRGRSRSRRERPADDGSASPGEQRRSWSRALRNALLIELAGSSLQEV
jgi:hypothetical protein